MSVARNGRQPAIQEHRLVLHINDKAHNNSNPAISMACLADDEQTNRQVVMICIRFPFKPSFSPETICLLNNFSSYSSRSYDFFLHYFGRLLPRPIKSNLT